MKKYRSIDLRRNKPLMQKKEWLLVWDWEEEATATLFLD